METTLPTLTTELVEHISHLLGPADISSLRLVCRRLYQQSLRSFGALFTTIRTDLSLKSLQKLQVISEDNNLRLHVQKLLIKQGEAGKLGQGFEWHRHSLGHLHELLPGFEKLHNLLAHSLPNCRSFHIYSPGGTEDESDALSPSDVIALILRIVPPISIDTSKSLPVKSLIVDFSSRGTGTINMKRLQMSQYRQPTFRNAWAPVQELVLEQSLTPESFDWEMDLTFNATRLRKLSLDFGFDQSGPFVERLCHVTSLHSLESLKLARANTSVDNLSRLIERSHDTLRVLSLRHISIQRLSDWPLALGQLKKHAPLLQKVSIQWLAAYGDEFYHRMRFPSILTDTVFSELGGRSFTMTTKKWKGERRVFGVDYQGPEVEKALKMLVKAAEYI